MIITPIAGEIGRFHVTGTNGAIYLCDLFENLIGSRCSGMCSCTDWGVRRQSKVAMATTMNDGDFADDCMCKHLKQCYMRFGQTFAADVVRDQLKRKAP